MKLIFAAVFALASVAGSTSSFAARGFAPSSYVGSRGIAHGSTPRIPVFHSRIPAPLPPPPQPPVINGPLTPNGLPSMGNGMH